MSHHPAAYVLGIVSTATVVVALASRLCLRVVHLPRTPHRASCATPLSCVSGLRRLSGAVRLTQSVRSECICGHGCLGTECSCTDSLHYLPALAAAPAPPPLHPRRPRAAQVAHLERRQWQRVRVRGTQRMHARGCDAARVRGGGGSGGGSGGSGGGRGGGGAARHLQLLRHGAQLGAQMQQRRMHHLPHPHDASQCERRCPSLAGSITKRGSGGWPAVRCDLTNGSSAQSHQHLSCRGEEAGTLAWGV